MGIISNARQFMLKHSSVILMLFLMIPITSFTPEQVPSKVKLEVISDSISKKVYPVANDGMIDLGPLIEVNKKMDNLIERMENDTIKKED